MQKLRLKKLKNGYCDALSVALGEFFDIRAIEDENDISKLLDSEELEKIYEFAVLKNALAGVGQLNLKVGKIGIADKYFEKYNICGKQILSARLLDCLTAKDFVGGRLIIEVENLLEYNEDYLSKIVDFCASTTSPVLVKMGQSLEEVGKVVNKFNSSPAEVLEDYGFLDRECFIYGLNFLDKEDQKLLKNYNASLVLSPKDDAESGRGAINLYNFVFNGLKFIFASGKCCDVDMFLDGKLAIWNTANLMYERGLVDSEDILSALQGVNGELMIDVDEEVSYDAILDQNVTIEDDELKNRFKYLRAEIKEIANKIKSVLN